MVGERFSVCILLVSFGAYYMGKAIPKVDCSSQWFLHLLDQSEGIDR